MAWIACLWRMIREIFPSHSAAAKLHKKLLQTRPMHFSADEEELQNAVALDYEPRPQFRPSPLQDDSARASCNNKRIGILIVTYNAVTTLVPVLKRISPNVWRNVEEVVVFDDASQDATFELA